MHDDDYPLQRLHVRGTYVYGYGIRIFYRDMIALARHAGNADRLSLIEWMIDTREYETLYDEGVIEDRTGRARKRLLGP